MFLAKVSMGINEYTCGSTGLKFSETIPYITSTAVLLIKVVVPVLLIIFGMLDLGKAVVASKEDDIKKGQQTFLKRVIAAVIVFFVVQVVQIVVRFVAGRDSDSVSACLNCFISGEISDSSCSTN